MVSGVTPRRRIHSQHTGCLVEAIGHEQIADADLIANRIADTRNVPVEPRLKQIPVQLLDEPAVGIALDEPNAGRLRPDAIAEAKIVAANASLVHKPQGGSKTRADLTVADLPVEGVVGVLKAAAPGPLASIRVIVGDERAGIVRLLNPQSPFDCAARNQCLAAKVGVEPEQSARGVVISLDPRRIAVREDEPEIRLLEDVHRDATHGKQRLVDLAHASEPTTILGKALVEDPLTRGLNAQ